MRRCKQRKTKLKWPVKRGDKLVTACGSIQITDANKRDTSNKAGISDDENC